MRAGYGKMNSQSVLGRLFLLCAFGVMPSQAASAGLVEDPWRIVCLVSNASTQSSRTFIRNENPFENSHTATLGNSSSTASYDFSWTGNEASFGVSVDHHLEQLDGFTSSSGQIYIRPSVDSIITLEGAWQYAWPSAAIGTTSYSMTVTDDEGIIARFFTFGGNFGLDPPFGSFNDYDTGLLRAGVAYLLTYTARVHHFDPTPPGTYGHGEGSLNFTITPVPEPATLALLVLSISIFKPRPGIMLRHTA
mgnify:CR=1 FL=1